MLIAAKVLVRGAAESFMGLCGAKLGHLGTPYLELEWDRFYSFAALS